MTKVDDPEILWSCAAVPMECAERMVREDQVMLILSRKVGERIRISKDIEVVVTAIKGDRIKIGIEAPEAIRVVRRECDSAPKKCGTEQTEFSPE